MQNLINDLRLIAEDVERRDKYDTSNDVGMLTASMLIVLAKVLEKTNDGDEELLGIFAAHLIEFIERFNDDEEADQNMTDIEKLQSLLEGVDFGE